MRSKSHTAWETDDEVRIRESGCEAYLSKPVPVAQFIETIRRFLGVGLSIPAR